MPNPPAAAIAVAGAPTRRAALAAGLGAAAALAGRGAGAQQPPAAGRVVTMVVPYAAGGGTDITGREFAQLFAQELGQTVVVVNPEIPARSLPEPIAYVRGRPPGDVAYSSGGVGNANHLAGVLFADAAG